MGRHGGFACSCARHCSPLSVQMLKEQVSEEETDQLLAVLNSEDDNTFEVRVLRALSKQAEETE